MAVLQITPRFQLNEWAVSDPKGNAIPASSRHKNTWDDFHSFSHTLSWFFISSSSSENSRTKLKKWHSYSGRSSVTGFCNSVLCAFFPKISMFFVTGHSRVWKVVLADFTNGETSAYWSLFHDCPVANPMISAVMWGCRSQTGKRLHDDEASGVFSRWMATVQDWTSPFYMSHTPQTRPWEHSQSDTTIALLTDSLYVKHSPETDQKEVHALWNVQKSHFRLQRQQTEIMITSLQAIQSACWQDLSTDYDRYKLRRPFITKA